MRSPVVVLPANAEMNVTPMLDVLLVLLVIFMTVAMAVHRTVDVHFPEPCTAICEGGSTITLEVLPGPTYRLDGTAVAPSELASTMRQVYVKRPEKIMYVAGRRGVTYESVVDAIDVAKSSGVRVVGIRRRHRPAPLESTGTNTRRSTATATIRTLVALLAPPEAAEQGRGRSRIRVTGIRVVTWITKCNGTALCCYQFTQRKECRR